EPDGAKPFHVEGLRRHRSRDRTAAFEHHWADYLAAAAERHHVGPVGIMSEIDDAGGLRNVGPERKPGKDLALGLLGSLAPGEWVLLAAFEPGCEALQCMMGVQVPFDAARACSVAAE